MRFSVPPAALAITLAFALSCSTFGQSARLDGPPAEAPPSCGINLASVSSVSGSVSYVRLRYEIEALNAAQESVDGLKMALKDFGSASNPTIALSSLITGVNQAHDSLLCASYLMGQYRPVDKDDKMIRAILISAFDREAATVTDLMAHTKEQFLRPANRQSNAVEFHDAERISAMNAQQNEAATDLLQTTTFSLLRAIDNSDPNAKSTEYLALSCDERMDLLAKNASLAQAEKSAYSTPGTFIQKVLSEHQCKY
jgi:hypothetical protein